MLSGSVLWAYDTDLTSELLDLNGSSRVVCLKGRALSQSVADQVNDEAVEVSQP